MSRRGLGRGLGALIPTGPPPTDETEAGAPADPSAPVEAAVAEPSAEVAPVPPPAAAPAPAPKTSTRSNGNGHNGNGHGPGGWAMSTGSGRPSPTDVFFGGDGSGGSPAAATAPAAAPAATPAATSPVPAAPAEPSDDAVGAYFAEIPLDRIAPNPRQPRQVFDEDELRELVHSIKEIGLLQPVVVRPLGEDRYELVVGERRWRASQRAETGTIPAIVRQTNDDDLLRDALLENLHRSQLNALEEAAAYDQLLKDFGCTHDELAGRIGRSRPQISNTLRLLKLPTGVQRRVAAGVLSAGHARALLGLEDPDAQDRLAHRIVAEGLSVRAVEEMVALGDVGDGRRARRRSNLPVAPGLEDLEQRLSESLETRVRIALGRSKGKVTIEFASLDDLRRIVSMIEARDGAAPAARSTQAVSATA